MTVLEKMAASTEYSHEFYQQFKDWCPVDFNKSARSLCCEPGGCTSWRECVRCWLQEVSE